MFITSHSREQLTNILDAATAVIRKPQRTLLLGVYLADFFAAVDPAGEPVFLDHRGRRHALLPTASQGNAHVV